MHLQPHFHTLGKCIFVSLYDGLLGDYPHLKFFGVNNVDEVVELLSDAFADLDFLFIFLALNKVVLHAGQVMRQPELFILNSDQSLIFLFYRVPQLRKLSVELLHQSVVRLVVGSLVVMGRVQQFFDFALLFVFFADKQRQISLDLTELTIRLQVGVVLASAVPLVLEKSVPALEEVVPGLLDALVVGLLVLVEVL